MSQNLNYEQYEMDINKLLKFNKELNKNGYNLTCFGVRKEPDLERCNRLGIWFDYKCIEINKIIDEKIKDGTFKIDERKNPKKNLISCYGFKHKLEKLTKENLYLTEGQMISIMVMKGLLRKWTKAEPYCNIKLLIKK